jgi:hypothetical protein
VTEQPMSDYDGSWKATLNVYLQEFLELCFPSIHAAIDWSRSYPKLLDFRERLAELEANRNPVAALVLAHLAAQQTRADPARRLQEKLALTRRLYDLGYSPKQRKAGAYASPVQSHGCFRTRWIDYWSPLKRI